MASPQSWFLGEKGFWEGNSIWLSFSPVPGGKLVLKLCGQKCISHANHIPGWTCLGRDAGCLCASWFQSCENRHGKMNPHALGCQCCAVGRVLAWQCLHAPSLQPAACLQWSMSLVAEGRSAAFSCKHICLVCLHLCQPDGQYWGCPPQRDWGLQSPFCQACPREKSRKKGETFWTELIFGRPGDGSYQGAALHPHPTGGICISRAGAACGATSGTEMEKDHGVRDRISSALCCMCRNPMSGHFPESLPMHLGP